MALASPLLENDAARLAGWTLDEAEEIRRPQRCRHGPVVLLLTLGGAATGAALLLQVRSQPDVSQVTEQLLKLWSPVHSQRRCGWVVSQFVAREDPTDTYESRRKQLTAQSKDFNVFFRATAHIFWKDFVTGGWGNFDLGELGVDTTLADGSPLQRTSTFTWVTGDQHLSNFGAWRNRNGEVVFGMNDFDEAAIYDFQIDVWRVAVSIYNHALTAGLGLTEAEAAVLTFTSKYVEVVISYVDNEDAATYEVTAATAPRVLASFLEKVEAKASSKKMLNKFTQPRRLAGNKLPQRRRLADQLPQRRRLADQLPQRRRLADQLPQRFRLADIKSIEPWLADDQGEEAMPTAALIALDESSGERRLVKNGKTRLQAVSDELYAQVVEAFGSRGYGATLSKVGWHEHVWSDDYFKVLDVGLRYGSGVGSFGVGRYYVLLAGDGDGVILDVKYEPEAAVYPVLSADDAAWYAELFSSDAKRAVLGQRALSAFVDPFTGWVTLDGVPHVVRERSAWKAGFDLASLQTYADFSEFMEAVATVTATSHVRASVSKPPGSFKEVIAAALGPPYARMTWGVAVAKVAAQYHEQVLADFECFAEYVNANYSDSRPS